MNGVELITRIHNEELAIGTKLKYHLNGSDGELYKGTCCVELAGSLIGLFTGGRSLSSVVIINGVFEVVE